MTLQQAIGREEGFGKPGTRATVNHNPGNIIWGPFARTHGALGGDDKGYAIWATDAAGAAALLALLTNHSYAADTVEQAINQYLGHPGTNPLSAGNDPPAYVNNVCTWLSCAPDTPIAGLLGTPPPITA